MSLKELTEELKLNKVTTFRLARTLVYEGLLVQDPTNDRYSLSFGCLALVDAMLNRDGLAEISRKHLRVAREETGETATILVREGWDRVVIATEASLQPVRYVMEVGRRNRVYLSGSGACLVSGMTEGERESLFAFIETDPIAKEYGHSMGAPGAPQERAWGRWPVAWLDRRRAMRKLQVSTPGLAGPAQELGPASP